MPEITLDYWQNKDYSVLQNNGSTIERCSCLYFTAVLSSIQQKTLAFVVVEVYPDIWEKDTRVFYLLMVNENNGPLKTEHLDDRE